jgi:hypothetical protein
VRDAGCRGDRIRKSLLSVIGLAECRAPFGTAPPAARSLNSFGSSAQTRSAWMAMSRSELRHWTEGHLSSRATRLFGWP